MAGAPDRTTTPRRAAARDLSGLQLTPMAGFVLSQIDGRTTIADLELVCGQAPEGMAAILEQLSAAGLIELPPPAAPEPAPRAAAAPAARSASPPPPPSSNPPPEAPSAGGLTPDEVKRIDRWLIRSTAADFYRLLQVPRISSRDEIRRAYFHYAKQFHPDAFYGRDLGVHAPKLDRIFRQLTRAYEVLSRPKSRKSYDEYLADQQILRGQAEEEQAWEEEERSSSTPPVPVPTAVTEATGRGAGPARADPEAEGPPIGAAEDAAEAPGRPGGGGAGDAASAAAVAAGGGSEDAGSSAGSPLSSAPGTGIEGKIGRAAAPRGDSSSDRWRRERTAKALAALAGGGRRRRPDRNGESYLDAAEEAAKGGEWGRVFGMLEVAAKLGVTEARREALEKLQRTAGRELAGICMRQSRFAESTGDLAAALRHAEEGVRYAPDDAESWHAVARFRLRQGRDLHQARDAAMKAIGIVPRAPAYRITLARIYLAAGLHKSARREAEQVLQAAGDNEEAKAILAEAGRATG